MKLLLITSLLGCSLWAKTPPTKLEAPQPAAPTNKLLYMYRFFYLPFSLDFEQGATPNDVAPFYNGTALTKDELKTLEKEWTTLRDEWKKKSLILLTDVPVGQTVRITPRLASHKIGLNRGPFDTLPMKDQIQAAELIKNRVPEVQAAFKQLRFLKSFLSMADEGRLNVFVISASWDESSREYRFLFEEYFKRFSDLGFNLHSVVVEDPKEQIFGSRLMTDLFPFPKRYSHENIPRFLALDSSTKGEAVVLEEGDVLKVIYDRFFASHRGFLDERVSFFRRSRGIGSSK